MVEVQRVNSFLFLVNQGVSAAALGWRHSRAQSLLESQEAFEPAALSCVTGILAGGGFLLCIDLSHSRSVRCL